MLHQERQELIVHAQGGEKTGLCGGEPGSLRFGEYGRRKARCWA